MKPHFEVASIIRAQWDWIYASPLLSYHKKRMLAALRDCRTRALGGHIDACTSCGTLSISYNSCRNRNCPKCQNIQREKWILKRQQELLPVTYFHLVFTIPACLNKYCIAHPTLLYNILFKAAWNTLQDFAKDPKHLGAKSGATMVLHTWGQNLMLHPHVHCIVPGGGLTKSGKWKNARTNGKFLFPVKAMSKVYRAKFIALLRQSKLFIDDQCYKQCFKKSWVVYAKRPFLGPQQVLEYLGRYSHKIAISNHRIKNIENQKVTFAFKDYRQQGANKLMTLYSREFIRRFALHILPHRFVRIRHYGLLASRSKTILLKQAAAELGVNLLQPISVDWLNITRSKLDYDPLKCVCCGGVKVTIGFLPPSRAPPMNPLHSFFFVGNI